MTRAELEEAMTAPRMVASMSEARADYARERAQAWALSPEGTPYGSTTPATAEESE